MKFMEWSNALSVHDAEIDREHRDILELINTLFVDVRTAKPPQTIERHLTALGSALATHFAHEEGLMKAASYGRLEEYQRLHSSLTRRNEDFLTRYRVGEAAMTINHVMFLKAWLSTHIQESDNCFAGVLKARQIPAAGGMRAGFDTLR